MPSMAIFASISLKEITPISVLRDFFYQRNLIILTGTNDSPNMKIYWSKDTVFPNSSISSSMSPDYFSEK